MQALVQTKVLDDEKKLAVLGMLADKYSRLILQATIDKPRSAMEISAEKKIPISSVYRRLQALHDSRLLSISGSISDDGKKYLLYKSRISEVSVSCNCETVDVEIVPNPSRPPV